MCNFLASKTRVAPVYKQMIPRIELLSTFLLVNPVDTVSLALKQYLVISSITSYTVSKVSVFWIKGAGKEWKPLIQSRVNGIRQIFLVSDHHFCQRFYHHDFSVLRIQ